MSNCIEFRGGSEVFFSREELDCDAFMAMVNKVKGLPEDAPEIQKGMEYIFWWFLSDNVCNGKDGIHILFGIGRSAHTWRDLAGTIRAISHYMLRAKSVSFTMSDESDGFATTYPHNVQFNPSAF